ncbi:unnamed protein product, partial [Brenthis ino]
MKAVTTLILLAISGLIAALTYQDVGQVYCGRRLATALAVLCDSDLIKRSQTHHRAAAVDVSWPWLVSHRAHSMGRGKRQAASECCDKPCTEDELLSYC